jgi:hypothetical protein
MQTRWWLGLGLGLVLLGLAEFSAKAGEPPWRGSELSYRNAASAISFQKDADPDYNPYYAMAVGIAPRWWFNSIFSVSSSLDIGREITTSDWTTKQGEFILDDIPLTVHATDFWNIPKLGIALSSSLGVITPASKESQSRTLILGLKPKLTLSRAFDLLKGAELSYSIAATKYLHRYTTGELQGSPIEGCISGVIDCNSLINTGDRNSSWRLTQALGASLDFFDWLGLSLGFVVIDDYLYPASQSDRISYEAIEPTSRRVNLDYEMELYTTIKAFTVALGASTVNPKQAPDTTDYEPVLNRYTEIYLDIRLNLAECF